MTIKKCSKCGKKEDFAEEPMCDKCAIENYSKLLLFDLIGELRNSNLKPIGEKKRIIKKLENMKLNEKYWEGYLKE